MAAVEEETGRLDASQARTLGAVRNGYTPFGENDVIFAKITPCMENGKIALATGLRGSLAYGSTEFIVFRPHDGLLPRFVLHFLLQSTLREEAEHQMAGASGQKRISTTFFFTHEFALPPTREQERIVAKLDAAFSSLERAEIAARRAQKRLERYRAEVLRAACSGELTRGWREHHWKSEKSRSKTGEALVQQLIAARRARWEVSELERLQSIGKQPKDDKWKSRYRDPVQPHTTDLPKLPETWTWSSLETIAEIGSGISVSQNRYVENPIELPYLRVANVMRGYLDLRQIKTIRVEREKASDYLLRVDDILFNEGGIGTNLGVDGYGKVRSNSASTRIMSFVLVSLSLLS
jgi:type I restriction enzyme S subunit